MKLIAVTACPTGIAHSQMAAENLLRAAERRGHSVRVERRGAMGTEDELTDAAIRAADAVVVAADASVGADRFADKPVVKASVQEAVTDAEGLVRRAESAAGEGDSERADAAGSDDSSTAGESRESRRLGGDPNRGLLARLKRLFS